ncbi:hypothetical protein [Flaviflexus massiliensis]|uniref:hypothetical protein n=1 Tax=Flaviflexus massiliensis TaxID=1522309 RepID=UPI0006D58C9C|nr:hypothetical protein [Flaviflexus massiliensis]
MSNDDRFRPQNEHPESHGGQYPPGQGSPHTGEGQNLQWSGQSPHTGQGPQWQGDPQQGYQNQQGYPQQGSGHSPHTGEGQNYQWSSGSAGTGEYPQQSQWPQQVPPPGGPGGPNQNWVQGGYPEKKRRSTAIIAVLVVIVLVLVGLGIWWWTGRSSEAEAADGAGSPEEAANLLAERINGEDFTEFYESMSPSEKQYGSALVSLLLSYSWETMSGGTGSDEDMQEFLTDSLDRYTEVVDYSLEIGDMTEVPLMTGMTGISITDGNVQFEITDMDEFGAITADLLTELYTEEQLYAMAGTADEEELADFVIEAANEAYTGPASFEFSESEPLVLVMVEEEKGWYVSPIASIVSYMNTDYFVDETERQSYIQRNGEFSLTTPTPSSSPEEATERFIKALSDESITDVLGYLPLAEQRGIGLAIYLADMPEIQEVTFGDLMRLSNVATTSVEISDHSALAILDAFLIDFNPALTGTSMQIKLEDEKLTIGTCEPVDVSILLDEDAPVLAFATIHDESGWNVSLIGTFVNAAGAVSTDAENMDDYEELANELGQCGF